MGANIQEDKVENREFRCLFIHLASARFLAGISQQGAWANYCGPMKARPQHRELRALLSYFNPLTAEWAFRALIDFTLSNARRLYSSMGVLVRPESNSRPPTWQTDTQPTEPPVRGWRHAQYAVLLYRRTHWKLGQKIPRVTDRSHSPVQAFEVSQDSYWGN